MLVYTNVIPLDAVKPEPTSAVNSKQGQTILGQTMAHNTKIRLTVEHCACLLWSCENHLKLGSRKYGHTAPVTTIR